jgi:hypothetical protein
MYPTIFLNIWSYTHGINWLLILFIQTNTSFMDMPWSDFSKLLAQQNRRASSSASSSASSNEVSSEEYDEQNINDDTLGNWDAQTGYQEGGKIIRQH